MAGRIIYTLPQISQILGMPESEVQMFIDSKQLQADFNQGLMGHIVTHDHLVEFMKARKMFTQMQKIMVSRVLLCDRDQQLTFILRTELERTGKITVKVATTRKEVEMALSEYLPDVLVMHMAAVQRAVDNLAGVLRRAREARPLRLILYHNQPDVVVAGRDEIKRMQEYLNVDAIVSVASGTKNLLAKVEEMLGLQRPSQRVPPLLDPVAAPPGVNPRPPTSRFTAPAPPGLKPPPSPARPPTRIEPPPSP